MANRRMLLTTVIASLLLAITPFQAASADREEETLRVLVPKIVAAWGTLDISQVEPYYATDPDFAYFDIAPMKYNNWKEYREGRFPGRFGGMVDGQAFDDRSVQQHRDQC